MENITLPFKNSENLRDVAIRVTNLQTDLFLTLNLNCDSNQVKTYLINMYKDIRLRFENVTCG
jgi:hypothetical protein